MVRVKICGLTTRADAEAALEVGADVLGFNFEPSSPRYLGPGAPRWIAELGPFAQTVAVFGRLHSFQDLDGFDFVQSVEWPETVPARPRRIEVFRLQPGLTQSDVRVEVGATGLLLDAYRDNAYGGTGHRVDWQLAAEIVRLSEIPVILAGGLTPDNVAEAVHTVRPYAVDVSSGVESSPGVKDRHKMRSFIAAAKGL